MLYQLSYAGIPAGEVRSPNFVSLCKYSIFTRVRTAPDCHRGSLSTESRVGSLPGGERGGWRYHAGHEQARKAKMAGAGARETRRPSGDLLLLLNVFAKKRKIQSDKGGAEREVDSLAPPGCGISKEDGKAKKTPAVRRTKASAGSQIIASLKEAVDWAEGKDVPVAVTTVKVPTVDVRATRKRLGLSQASFAAKFGFQTATVRNWEQGRMRPSGPARLLLAVIASHPEAVEDALRRAS